MSRDAFESRTWTLRAGETRLLHMPAGGRWVAARGMLRLTEPPRWLGERMLSVSRTLREGDAQGVEAAGWVRVRALSDSTLLAQTPVSMFARWFRTGRAPRVLAAAASVSACH